MIYVLGATGGIGRELVIALKACAVTRAECLLTSEHSVEQFMLGVESELEVNEPVHFVNAAGISKSAMIHKGSEQDWSGTLDVNLVANLRILKHARAIWKQHRGSLTILSSVTPELAPVGTAAYSASKAGVEALVQVAAKEVAPFARVNAIALGYSRYGMIQQIADVDAVVRTIPLGRLANIVDIATAVTFCMNCGYLTGATVKLNGGIA